MLPSTIQPEGDGGMESKMTRKQRLFESQREREFYSYYESVLAYASKEPKFCDLYDPEEAAAHRAVSSSDATLTAFTQLAALRIGTRRAMIFFFDSDHAYIFAESTQTLSFTDDAQHAPGDSLWLGFTKIPRGLSVCEVTATLPVNEGSNAQDPDTCTVAHIVNNLAEDTRFCDRPYVQYGPKARFYAGVPITTPKGINIGAFCVLDDKPRDGLEKDQVDLLRNLASAVMSHLELVRAKEDNQRSCDMNTALGAFAEGRSNARDWWHRSGHAPNEPAGQLKSFTKEPRIKTFNARVPITPKATDRKAETLVKDDYFASSSLKETHEGNEATLTGLPQIHDSPASSKLPWETVTSSRPTLGSRNGSDGSTNASIPSHTRDDEPNEDIAARIKATANRAAGLIQEGLGADGVLFLDATIGTFGGLISGAQGLSATETETDASHVSEAGDLSGRKHLQDKKPASAVKSSEPAKHSVVLGSAYSGDIQVRVREAIQEAKFSERVLRSLLRRYPDGQVWHFNSDGEASDEDDFVDTECISTTSAGESASSEQEQNTTPSKKRAAKKLGSRKRDGRVIQEIFPGIRSLIFLGMWDPHEERWFGAAIVLSYSATRIFSARSELSYLAAFCDVVLGEIWRLESHDLSRSKSDFISSISHELRSPLHGILGSAECLEDQEQNALSLELIRSINSCGATLLDVINDLLEYSRLNHGTQQRRNLNSSKNTKTTSDASAIGDTSETDSAAMVSTLTEDAVNAACLGYKTSDTSDTNRAVLSLNIDEAQSPDWLLSVPSGSWKRICLNLISNALKYTPSGYISATLRKKKLDTRDGKEKKSVVEFMVEDSGVGMSDEFQVKSLFRPFKQENALAPGTGLGLNLVAQIVKSLGGTVHVRSSQQVGTTVKVSVPLRHPLSKSTAVSSTTPRAGFSFTDASVRFLGFITTDKGLTTTSLSSKANRKLFNSLKRGCKQLGLSVYESDDRSDQKASIYVIQMDAFEGLNQLNHQGLQHPLLSPSSLGRPFIVLCPTQDSALKFQNSSVIKDFLGRARFIWLPVGPEKLAGAISGCLNTQHNGEHTAAARNAVRLSSSKEPTDPAHDQDEIRGSQPLVVAYPGASPDSFEDDHVKDNVSESSLPLLHKRSGSEVMTRAGGPSVQLRTQINRSITAPYRSEEAVSLLLVDDNAINLRLLEVFAKREGHPYRTAQNGQEAVEIYEKAARQNRPSDDSLTSDHGQEIRLAGKPEVVLMDINMPVMNGFEATRAIRRFEKASGSPPATIVGITGLGDSAAQDESFASGMDLFLTKPVKMKELKGVLKRFRGIDQPHD